MKKQHHCTPFGMKVKIRLLEKNMTNKELAGMIGMAESTICDVVFGRNNRPRTQRSIAEALELDVDDF